MGIRPDCVRGRKVSAIGKWYYGPERAWNVEPQDRDCSAAKRPCAARRGGVDDLTNTPQCREARAMGASRAGDIRGPMRCCSAL